MLESQLDPSSETLLAIIKVYTAFLDTTLIRNNRDAQNSK